MDTLGTAVADLLKSKCAQTYNMRPFLCVDNIDITARIHEQRVGMSTRTFHGTYGFLHFLPEHLLKDISPQETTVSKLLEYVKNSQLKPFEPSDMLPNQREAEHYQSVQKCSLVRALLDYVLKGKSPAHIYCRSKLCRDPPPLEKIQMYDPDIVMLKMMSASDNSAAGVGDLLCQCNKQTGEDKKGTSENMRVMEGDMGTCLLCESYIRKLFPAGHKHEAMDNILNMPGLAHTLWNVSSKVTTHHWGDPTDSMDTGLHRTAGALGMKTDKPPSKQDFNSLMVLLHKSQTATLVFLLK